MSDIWRRNGTVCTDNPRCFRECRCSRWPDYINRFGNYVVPHAGSILPCFYLTFDAVPDDYIGLAGITLTPPFTIVAWCKRRTQGIATHAIIGGAATRAFYIRNANSFRGVHTNTSTSTVDATLDWQHLAWTAPAAANGELFRNGVNATAVGAIAAGALVYNYIGYYNVAGTFFDGQLATIGIAPGVLDIAARWAAGDFHTALDPAVFTIACWNGRQEGGAGATLIDESASGNDGTFKAAGEPTWGGLMSVGGPAGWTD